MDMYAISNGLASRYTTANLGTPTGVPPMRGTYGQAPHGAPPTPFLVVYPQEGSITIPPSLMDGEHNLEVVFYLSKASGDIPRDETVRQKWLGLLLTGTFNAMKLGLAASGVQKALPISWEFTERPYNGDDYDAIVIGVRVWTEDSITLVAA